MCNPVEGRWPDGPSREGSIVKVKATDGTEIDVHIASPDGDPPYPTIVIIHDYFDPHVYYHELANRYAAQGYLAVVPNFFQRQGRLAEQTHELAGVRIGDVADQQVFDDFEVVLAHLEAGGLLGDLVLSGFCWGGRMTYLLAARHHEARLLVPFYGHLTAWTGPDGPHPGSPLDEASNIDTRVVGSYGGADDSIPLDQVRDM